MSTTTTTMDAGRTSAPEADTRGLKDTAIGLFYLFGVGTAFTALLSLGLVLFIGE